MEGKSKSLMAAPVSSDFPSQHLNYSLTLKPRNKVQHQATLDLILTIAAYLKWDSGKLPSNRCSPGHLRRKTECPPHRETALGSVGDQRRTATHSNLFPHGEEDEGCHCLRNKEGRNQRPGSGAEGRDLWVLCLKLDQKLKLGQWRKSVCSGVLNFVLVPSPKCKEPHNVTCKLFTGLLSSQWYDPTHTATTGTG